MSNPSSTTPSNSSSPIKFNLYPNLNQIDENELEEYSPKKSTKNEEETSSYNFYYKLRMHHTDVSNITNETINFTNSTTSETINSSKNNSSPMLSTSLPSTSYLSFKFQQQQQQSSQNLNSNHLFNNLNQLLKQAAYQFHLIFQTKLYNTDLELIELANYVNQHLQHGNSSSNSSSSSSHAQYFCLPQCLNMSKYLSAKLFNDKYYLY